MEKTYDRGDAQRMRPLLRSIGREIRDRRRALELLEGRREALSPTRRVHAEEIAHLDADISTHRRELRRVEKELERLGCNLETEHPLRITIPGPGGDWDIEEGLDDTRFHEPQDTSA